MTRKRIISVICKDQNELNNAVNHWVNVKGLSRLYTGKCSVEADHFVLDGAGNWTKCKSNRNGEKMIIIFGK